MTNIFEVHESEFITLRDSDFIIENGILKKYVGMSTKIEVPEGVIVFDEYAFENSPIRELICPSTLKRIEKNCFMNSALHKINLNYGLLVIHDYAFANCDMLTDVQFPISIKVIGARAFSNTKISRVKLPEDILYVASDAFGGTPFKDYIKQKIKRLYFENFDDNI